MDVGQQRLAHVDLQKDVANREVGENCRRSGVVNEISSVACEVQAVLTWGTLAEVEQLAKTSLGCAMCLAVLTWGTDVD
jgi:hypothetical protein